MVEMLRRDEGVWTPERVQRLIDREASIPDAYLERVARYMLDRPELWEVSDDEFLAAVRAVNADCALALDCPAGLALMHRMSVTLGAKLALLKLRRLLGVG